MYNIVFWNMWTNGFYRCIPCCDWRQNENVVGGKMPHTSKQWNWSLWTITWMEYSNIELEIIYFILHLHLPAAHHMGAAQTTSVAEVLKGKIFIGPRMGNLHSFICCWVTFFYYNSFYFRTCMYITLSGKGAQERIRPSENHVLSLGWI